MASKIALEILKNANWKPKTIGEYTYITATYKGDEVSIRGDSYDLVVKRRGKVVKCYDVGGTEEFESLFGLFW